MIQDIHDYFRVHVLPAIRRFRVFLLLDSPPSYSLYLIIDHQDPRFYVTDDLYQPGFLALYNNEIPLFSLHLQERLGKPQPLLDHCFRFFDSS
jgi:hypothetical protein